MPSSRSELQLSMLEAIQLFNGKPPAEWTPEELAAFRARAELSPSVVTAVGGPKVIERRLAEVAAALANAKEKPIELAAVPDAVPKPKPFPLRRLVEAAIVLWLLGGGGYWLTMKIRSIEDKHTAQKNQPKKGESEADKKGETKSAATATKKNPAAEPEAPPEDDQWRGWTIKTEGKGQWTKKIEWDLAMKPNESLTLQNGIVRFSQRRKLAAEDRFLEIYARPRPSDKKTERVVVKVNGTELGQLKIGTGEARWPAFVSLEKYAGQEATIDVLYDAGGEGQQIAWKNLEIVPQQRQVAKRINCGGALVESQDGDWEPDDSKSSPYLTSTGTRTWATTAVIPGAEDLPSVYQDERWAYQYIVYSVAVEPGSYDVVLHFAETNKQFQAPGKRLFDIVLNNHTVAEKYDIFKAAGGSSAVRFKHGVEATQGRIEIRLQANPTGPAIKGIEIIKHTKAAAHTGK